MHMLTFVASFILVIFVPIHIKGFFLHSTFRVCFPQQLSTKHCIEKYATKTTFQAIRKYSLNVYSSVTAATCQRLEFNSEVNVDTVGENSIKPFFKQTRSPHNKGKQQPEELKLKIKKTINARCYQDKILKACSLGMSVEEFDHFRLEKKREYVRQYRKRMKLLPKKPRSMIAKSLWDDAEYRNKVNSARVVYYESSAVMKRIAEKALQQLWSSMPLPSGLSKTQRRFLLCKAVAGHINKDVNIVDDENFGKHRETRKNHRLSVALKKKWKNPMFRSKILQALHNHHSTIKQSLSSETKNKISLTLKSLWQNPEYRSKFMANRRSARPQQHFNESRPRSRSKFKGAPNHANKTRARRKKKSEYSLAVPFDKKANQSSKGITVKKSRKTSDKAEALIGIGTSTKSTQTSQEGFNGGKILTGEINTICVNDQMENIEMNDRYVEPLLKRPEKRPILADEGVASIKVYKDGKLVGIYTKEEYDLLGLSPNTPEINQYFQ